MKVIPETRRIQ